MAISFNYRGQTTNAVSVAGHPNGVSPAPISYTFTNSVLVVDGEALQAN